MASSLINCTSDLHIKPYLRSSQALLLNPISNLRISKPCKDQFGSLSKGVFRFNGVAKRNAFVVYANTVPGAPLPSGPPPSSSMSWVLGLIVSLIIPFLTNKLGPLGVIKSRIVNAVQQVEDIAEAVEKVAGEVDKIAENIAHDLPDGKLKNLMEMVEDVAEKTAKQADCLDNLIDEIQEAEEQVEDIIAASVAEKVKQSPKQEAKDQ